MLLTRYKLQTSGQREEGSADCMARARTGKGWEVANLGNRGVGAEMGGNTYLRILVTSSIGQI